MAGLIRATALVSAARRLFRSSEASLILLAVGVGILAGLLASLLGKAAWIMQSLLYGLGTGLRLSGLVSISPARLLALPIGGLVLGALVLFTRRKKRTSIDVVEANALHGGRIPLRDTTMVCGQTLISNGFGASVGLEAAYAQAGGGIASLIGQWLNLRRGDLRVLVGAGSGAAIGAAFGAPLTGAFYAFEIVIGACTPASIAPVVAATISAVITARTRGATPYLIAAQSSQHLSAANYILYAGLGLIAALLGIAIMRLVSLAEAGGSAHRDSRMAATRSGRRYPDPARAHDTACPVGRARRAAPDHRRQYRAGRLDPDLRAQVACVDRLPRLRL